VPSRRQPTHNLHIPRQQLRSELLAQLPRDVVRWGHRFVRYEEVEPRDAGGEPFVRLHLENEAKEPVARDVALLVAADGIYSAVCQQLFAAAPSDNGAPGPAAPSGDAAAHAAAQHEGQICVEESALDRYERLAAPYTLHPTPYNLNPKP
jgi:hypothetical protein